MGRNLRVFLCLILSVILPISFVGCKKQNESPQTPNQSVETPKDDAGDDDNITDTDNDSGAVDDDNQTINLTNEKVFQIISNTTYLDNFVSNINNSQILKENECPSSIGERLCFMLNASYYPSFILGDIYNKYSSSSTKQCYLDINKLYAYSPNGRECRFIKINTDEEDNKIEILTVSLYDDGKFEFFRYIFKLSSEAVIALDVSYISSVEDSKGVDFRNASFDFLNSQIKFGQGNVFEYSQDTDEFVKLYFTEEKFVDVNLSLAYYLNVDFGSVTKTYNCCTETADAKTRLNDMVNEFNFADAYEKFDEYNGLHETNQIDQSYYLQYNFIAQAQLHEEKSLIYNHANYELEGRDK